MIYAGSSIMGNQNEKGIMLALSAALVSGFSVFMNGIAVSTADPSAYTTLKGLLVLVFLAAGVMALKEVRSFQSLTRRQWAMLALIGLIGGSMPFLMFFWGLKLGGAAVSSFIYRSLFLFAGIFGYLLLKERPEPRDVAAGLAIMAGNALLVSGGIVFGLGQWLVLGATALWALEYTISRKVMADVHPRVVMVGRMLFGSVILVAFLASQGSLGTLASGIADTTSLMWLVLASALLFAFLNFWYQSLRYLPVLKATSLFAIGGVVTAALNLVFLGKSVSLIEAAALMLVLAGALAMVGATAILRSVRDVRHIVPSLVE
jgi:drug/metabolite transporter (DMT)-like permease